MKKIKYILSTLLLLPAVRMSAASSAAAADSTAKASVADALLESAAQSDSIFSMMGANLFENAIDEVLFQTNTFLTDGTFTGVHGPFWYILQASMCLAALFAILMGAGMAYKMMVKGEPFDPIKILRVLGIAMVMMLWYGDKDNGGILDSLAYIPNAIGSWTHDLYNLEASNVQDKVIDVTKKLKKVQDLSDKEIGGGNEQAKVSTDQAAKNENFKPDESAKQVKQTGELKQKRTTAGTMILIDKLLFYLSMIVYRIGVWGTIYVQQILLGVLTIFGPIQWAFSILPKWEGAWAKWLTRYLTVHLYGAMIYFVGFYVMLLFDVVLSIQADQLGVIIDEANDYENFGKYIGQIFMTSGYMLVTSGVAVKCLNLIPDLASWIIPEGETSMSVRGFGEGLAQSVGGRFGIR